MARLASSSESLRTGPEGVCAAEMTMWSHASFAAKKASIPASSAVSMAAVRTPCPIRLAASASLSAERDAIVTAAPAAAACSATARPIPELPPTTRTR